MAAYTVTQEGARTIVVQHGVKEPTIRTLVGAVSALTYGKGWTMAKVFSKMGRTFS